MTPTNQLRWVKREIKTPYGNEGAEVSKTIHVLQQKWAGTDTYSGGKKEEWRDVPVEEETP